jgi:hypothetical protein
MIAHPIVFAQHLDAKVAGAACGVSRNLVYAYYRDGEGVTHPG